MAPQKLVLRKRLYDMALCLKCMVTSETRTYMNRWIQNKTKQSRTYIIPDVKERVLVMGTGDDCSTITV